MLLDRKFNEDSKNILKTVIFSLQVGLTSKFVTLVWQQLSKFAISGSNKCYIGSIRFDAPGRASDVTIT